LTGIRTYHDNDFDAVLKLLNENSDFDSFSEVLLKEKIYDDPDYQTAQTLLAISGDRVVGFMLGVKRNIRGVNYAYIKLMAVEKTFRRSGLATEMYLKLEKIFKEAGVSAVRIYDTPLNYFMPGIDPGYTAAVCFALKQGFVHVGDACNMKVDLNSRTWATEKEIKELKKEDIEIYRANESDKEDIIDFISKEWELWKYELEMAFRTSPTPVFIARKDGLVKAFSAYDGNNVGTAWFGPMGTDDALRGKGIGKILLYLCLTDMKNKGFHLSVIPWVAPIAFYSHHADAVIDRVFWRFEKKLNDEK
jgi:mycothiol synthase